MSARSQRQLAELLGLVPADQPNPEPEEERGPPEFDGGVRESAPVPSDPEADLNAFVLDLIRNHSGGGGLW
jgi:hypothetical protein